MASFRLTRAAMVLTLTAVAAGLATPADAARRARLGTDLEQKLAQGSQAIDVIVHGTRADVDALARRYNLRVRRQLKEGAVLAVTAGQLDALAQDSAVDHLSSDAEVRSSSLQTEAIGADQVWAGVGKLQPLSGAGIGVAVIDSGMDTRHPALARRVLFTKDFIGGDGSDVYGHGTHVGALIAGRAGRTADTEAYQGVAPSARLINLRVLDGRGAGRMSDVIEAIDWAIDNRRIYNIRVINLSLGAPVVQSYKDDPLCEAVERAVAAGIVVVAAAGNHGATKDGSTILGGITSPGNDPAALTVGAVDMHDTVKRSDDTVAKYSSRGPTLFDLVLKPDVVAPGSRLVSAEAAGSYLATTYPEKHVAGAAGAGYMTLSGTSMAAGVASGAVALLLDQRPSLSPAAAKAALQLTSGRVEGAGFIASGSGELNAMSSVALVVRSASAAVMVNRSTVGGEQAVPFGLTTSPEGIRSVLSKSEAGSIIWGNALGAPVAWSDSIIWGTSESIVWGNSIIWGNTADSIIWGNSIIWGTTADSIIWGNSIVWGNQADSIVWGNQADSIIWGSSSESIVWGNVAESIVWGNAIVWGSADSIIWGTADSIIWGTVGSIVWGNADSIVWGN